MTQLSQLSGIRSQFTGKILGFYLARESECENAPLSPWQDGRKLKGSEIYVQMQLLTERIELRNSNNRRDSDMNRETNNGGKDNSTNGLNASAQNAGQTPSPDENAKAKKNKSASNNEDIHQFDEQIKRKQREPWEKIFGGKELRIIFKGGAGSGKSFSLSQEVRERLVKARTMLEDFNCSLNELEIPIIIKAGSLVASSRENIADVIIDILSDSSKAFTPQVSDWLRYAFQTERGRRLFIVIDGLDELPETSQNHFRERMEQLDALESASLVVSCRTMYFDERQYWVNWAGERRAQVVELAPIEEEQQIALIKKLVRDNETSTASLLGLLKRNYTLNHFCRTPLILTSTCLLYADGWLSETTNYASLYKTLTGRILSGDWKDQSGRPEWTKEPKVLRDGAQQDRIDLLPKICWHLFEASPSENRFTLKQWREAYKKASSDGHATTLDATQLLNELEFVGMTIEAGYDAHHDPCYSFIHRTILEYFAAHGLVEQYEEEVWSNNLVKHIWCESEWTEVIRFAASIVDNPTPLLRSIAAETGHPTAPSRPFHWRLSAFCSLLRGYILRSFIIIFILAGISIWQSELTRNLLGQYFENLWQSLPGAGEAFNSFINHPTGVVNLLLDEFLKLYHFVFHLLYNETLYSKDLLEWNLLGLINWVEFLIPYLILLYGLTLLGSFLVWMAKKIFYRKNKLKQDDIFRTGLRVQAEVVGQNNNFSEPDVKRLIDELLASEKNGGAQIHGAAEEGGIPENLLLLIANNTTARRMLHNHWLSLIDRKYAEMRKMNRLYYRIIFWYKKILDKISIRENSSLFKAGDFLSAERLIHFLSDPKRDVTKYLREKLSPHTRDLGRKSDKSDKNLITALVNDFNKFLDDASLYDEAAFQEVYLRTETRNLLKQNPTGEKLRRLNRLLLEDAYPYDWRAITEWYVRTGLKRKQTRWLQPVHWFVKRNLYRSMKKLDDFSEDSDVFRAMRGLYLLPDVRAIKSLRKFLRQKSRLQKHLLFLNALESGNGFSEFDVYAAKALAKNGDLYGKRRLINFGSRLGKQDRNTPLAIKELSLFDEKCAIRLAAASLNQGYQTDSAYSYVEENMIRDVLLSLPFERVLTELISLCNEDISYFRNILLIEFLLKTGGKEAKESLQKIADSSDNQALADDARKVLEEPSNKPWTYGENWIKSRIDEIQISIDEKKFESAAEYFNKLISYSRYRHSYVPESGVLMNNLEKVASVCNKELLEAWLKNHTRGGEMNKNLILLAKEPTGGVVKETLIKWAEKCSEDKRFHSNYVDNTDDDHLDYNNMKAFLLLALGDLGKGAAEAALLKMLYEARRKTSSFRRIIDGTKFDTRLIIALGKIGSDKVLQELEEELNYPYPPITNYIVARLWAERNNPLAIEYFLKGKKANVSWGEDFGAEPNLRELAIQFGARITKVNQEDDSEYVAVSQSRNFECRVSA